MIHMLSKQEEQQAKINSMRCMRNIQAGDISTHQFSEEAVMLFGETKAGKTTAAHHLSGLPLIATKAEGDLAFVSNLQNPNVVGTIGSAGSSETEIPNIFQCELKKGTTTYKIRLIDQPGYGDSNGFFSVYSNGYFHYRTFSKNQRLKFIIVVNRYDLYGIAQSLKSSIFNFISSFKNYDILQPLILEATSLLITRTDSNLGINDLHSILSNLIKSTKSMTEGQTRIYTNFLFHMIAKGKVFMFKKPNQQKQVLKASNLLDEILSRTTFWQRQKDGDSVDMSSINFSVSGQIVSKITNTSGNRLFRPHFQYFISFTQKRIQDLLITGTGSLLNTLKSLIEDSVSESASCSFITKNMAILANYEELDKNYDKKREKIRSQIFQGGNLPVIYESKQYFIKKFQVLEVLVAEMRKIQSITQDNVRDIVSIDKIRDHLLKILQAISRLCLQKPQNSSIFQKFGYQILRLVQQTKIFSLILFTDPVSKQKIEDQLPMYASKADIIRPLHDKIVSSIVELKVVDLKKQFLKKHGFSKLTPTMEIINFIENIPDQDTIIKLGSSNFLLKYYKNSLKKVANYGYNLDLATKLLKKREEFYKLYQTLRKDDNIIMQTILLSDALGEIFANLAQYSLSRLFYQSTLKVKKVFDVFEMQILEASKRQNNQSKLRSIYKEYGLVAAYYLRRDVAARSFDEVYSLSTNMDEIRQASRLRVLCQFQDDKKGMQRHRMLINELKRNNILGKLSITSVLQLPENTLYLKMHEFNEFIQPISPQITKKIAKMNQDVNLNPEKSFSSNSRALHKKI